MSICFLQIFCPVKKYSTSWTEHRLLHQQKCISGSFSSPSSLLTFQRFSFLEPKQEPKAETAQSSIPGKAVEGPTV